MGLLSPGEALSPIWFKIREELEKRLKDVRSKLENPQLDHEQTQTIRGRILELKSMLDFAKEDPDVTD